MSTSTVSFSTKKEKILKELSLPDEEYTDLSPKGSVDLGIRHLLRDINRIPGLVTTSSCAGRISVFAEGGKDVRKPPLESRELEADHGEEASGNRFARTAGKGAGRWQFISHDPVIFDKDTNIYQMFELEPSTERFALKDQGEVRLVRFQFEPMILHVMTASLKDAQPVLAAASTAGFRESGLQGLRCLEDPDSCPVVAVRSSGLALESIIGYLDENENGDVSAKSLVDEEYLRLLVQLANERFKTNTDRVERFRVKLLELIERQQRGYSSKHGQREDPDARRERKRAEGLQQRDQIRDARHAHDHEDNEADMSLGLLSFEP
ncbi:hypothetical protein FQN57_000790 [Myotisia sp. PD_48]|nr:hypothetical protein FQN57_000790 [Myotisia sp. PD_48]